MDIGWGNRDIFISEDTEAKEIQSPGINRPLIFSFASWFENLSFDMLCFVENYWFLVDFFLLTSGMQSSFVLSSQ